jgi:hypothetical protein
MCGIIPDILSVVHNFTIVKTLTVFPASRTLPSNPNITGGSIMKLLTEELRASLSISHPRLVYVGDSASGRAVMGRLSRAVVPIVIVIRSELESPDVSAWRDDTCYVEIKRETLDVRRLVAITLHHRCSQ